jgi:phytoene dehydrogenase-like protein
MKHDVIIVGGGASGLTAAAYLSRAGRKALLLEKEDQLGGLVNSFERDGFIFDGGLRAFDSAGVLMPMLDKLGLEMDLVKNIISIGIENRVIRVESDQNIGEYEQLLQDLYPESKAEITAIIVDMRKMMHFLDIQYGIDNPLFLDFKEDRDYFIKKVFPWMFRFALTAPRIAARNQPVEAYLRQFTQNQKLIDIIAQHFFTATPAYFALSYFSLYQDYYFPKGGTGVFVSQLTKLIQDQGGQLRTGTQVTAIDPERKTIATSDGETLAYNQLLWTADQKTLYRLVDISSLSNPRLASKVNQKRDQLADLAGNDSIFTLYVCAGLPADYFKNIASGHFFYTPSRKGQSQAGPIPRQGSWEQIQQWLKAFFALTTYEISIPVLRDPSLAPEGKTGLIISVLFDYGLAKYIDERGWGAQFRSLASDMILKTLSGSIYPGLAGAVLDQFCATPLTVEKRTGSTDGAITGWAFTNDPMPAESRLVKIANAVNTPLPDIHQAGQWTYSPSGFPIALITGKLAADKIDKRLKRR